MKIVIALVLLLIGAAEIRAADVLYGLNDAGTRAGQRWYCGSVPCGIVGGAEVKYPGARETGLTDVNNLGVSVGFAVSSGGAPTAIRCQGTTCGTLPGVMAWRINDSGDVLLRAREWSTTKRAYVYADKIMSGATLTAVPPAGPGTTYTYALNGLRDTGGVLYDPAQTRGTGYVRVNGVVSWVSYPGATITTVYGLNDRGDVAGIACMRLSRTYNVAGATCLDERHFRIVGGALVDVTNGRDVNLAGETP